jgi:hypothetical protein
MLTPGFTRSYFHFSLRENGRGRSIGRVQRRGAPDRINGILTNLMAAGRNIGSGTGITSVALMPMRSVQCS